MSAVQAALQEENVRIQRAAAFATSVKEMELTRAFSKEESAVSLAATLSESSIVQIDC